ncbi:TPA: DUF551 domain-containing protein [Enterobacter hormaechei subsp. xiangfangensis]|nr:DUF551 domain-containing protein [Enterobacter hormaechei subsp. xiangfangensis]
MSTITKEFTKEQLISAANARMEFAEMMMAKDLLPLQIRNWSIELELARIALASLEAEPVVFRSKLKPPSAIGSENWDYTDHRQPDAFELESCVIERLYTAPPAPVSVPAAMEMDDDFDSAFEHGKAVGWNACRAAMLQGAKPVTTAYKLPPHVYRELVNSLRDTAVKYQGCQQLREQISETLSQVIAHTPPCGNSPVIPDGYVLVPKRLTAENGAKTALIGEFNLEYSLTCHECFGEGCDDCSGEGTWINTISVDWSTIKDIWANAIDHFTAAPQQEVK